MAGVTSYRLWLNPLDDLNAGRGFRLGSMESDPQIQARVDQFGPSRRRPISTGVTFQQLSVLLRCSRADIDWLTTYAGLPGVMVRDPRGRKFAAIYTDPKIPEQYNVLVPVNITLTLNEITFSEVS